MEENGLGKTSNTLLGIIVIAVLLGVMVLAIAVVYPALSGAALSSNGVTYTSSTVTNETGYANATGYTLLLSTADGFRSPALVTVWNRTAPTKTVALANFTLSTAGKVTNATAVIYNNLSITYTYVSNTTSTNSVNTALDGMKTNSLSMVGNFFALAPTIGTILAVVILIGGIVLLVLYVKRMKGSNDTSGSYTG